MEFQEEEEHFFFFSLPPHYIKHTRRGCANTKV
jgi:hypothetical protein